MVAYHLYDLPCGARTVPGGFFFFVSQIRDQGELTYQWGIQRQQLCHLLGNHIDCS